MKFLPVLFIVTILIPSCQNNDDHIVMKTLDSYPSASAIEYINGKLYITGDDATGILVLDTNLYILDSIPLIDYPGKRIPKDIKPDLESSVYFQDKGTVLFLFGSGSLTPYRNNGWWYYFETNIKDSMPLQSLYAQIKKSGIKELNIEGSCITNQYLVLSNRGNKSYPENHLVITDRNFWNNDSSFQIKVIPVITDTDTAFFSGISGLCYAPEKDKLIMTVSTEDTRNSFEDGVIGKSFLWIVNQVSAKINDKDIHPDRIIDLEKIDSRFKGQKIESATVIRESIEQVQLVLVADNDKGSSTVFKLTIEYD